MGECVCITHAPECGGSFQYNCRMSSLRLGRCFSDQVPLQEVCVRFETCGSPKLVKIAKGRVWVCSHLRGGARFV